MVGVLGSCKSNMAVEEPRVVEGKKADESMVLDPEGGGGGK